MPLKWAPWSKKSSFEAIDLQPLWEGAMTLGVHGPASKTGCPYWENRQNPMEETGEDFLLWRQSKTEIVGRTFTFLLRIDTAYGLDPDAGSSEISFRSKVLVSFAYSGTRTNPSGRKVFRLPARMVKKSPATRSNFLKARTVRFPFAMVMKPRKPILLRMPAAWTRLPPRRSAL